MDPQTKKKVRSTTTKNEEGDDRISSLPDDLIHHILSFSDSRLAVQTSVLSKRWKLTWTTLPSFASKSSAHNSASAESKFIKSFLSRRNHESHILKLYFSCFRFLLFFSDSLVEELISYAISHNVQNINVDYRCFGRDCIKLSAFTSTSIKTLTLAISELLQSDCWDLPALTTLHLIIKHSRFLPASYLTCLASLRTLFLDGFELPNSITLPSLTKLYLGKCKLPKNVWKLPALLALTLDDVAFSENISEFLLALVNLRNLTLFIRTKIVADFFINCPQLVNLEINVCTSTTTFIHTGTIIVLAPKICNFGSVGIFSITFGVSELENVNIKLVDSIRDKTTAPSNILKKYYRRVTHMFPGLGSARILTLDLEAIEALSAVSNFLVRSPSPFYNLKYVKVPQGYKESSMSTNLKRYLFCRSPKATIVTTLPQNKVIPQRGPISLRAQNVQLEEPLATPSKELVESQDIHKKVGVNSREMRMQEQVVGNFAVDAGTAGQVSSLGQGFNGQVLDAPVAGANNNQASSSSRGNSHFGIWQGHEVNAEFVGLLDLIMKKYPETFEHFNTKSKKLCTIELNALSTSVNAFTKTTMTEVGTELITEYRDLFAYLQKSFNIEWLVCRLNYIEQLRFSKPLLNEVHAIDARIDDAKSKLQDMQTRIDDAKSKLQDMQTLRIEKLTEIEKAFGPLGASLATSAGYIGDDLL